MYATDIFIIDQDPKWLYNFGKCQIIFICFPFIEFKAKFFEICWCFDNGE
jgi:hypothetical protein